MMTRRAIIGTKAVLASPAGVTKTSNDREGANHPLVRRKSDSKEHPKYIGNVEDEVSLCN